MIKSLKYLSVIGALSLGTATASLPATAQLGVDLGTDVDVGVGVGVTSPDPRPRHEHYVYDGYNSGRWYTRHEVHRNDTWHDHYHGYDCYESFKYTWEDGERVRYDTTFCYDEHGRKYEPDNARVVVQVK